MVEQGIRYHFGEEILKLKKPVFNGGNANGHYDPECGSYYHFMNNIHFKRNPKEDWQAIYWGIQCNVEVPSSLKEMLTLSQKVRYTGRISIGASEYSDFCGRPNFDTLKTRDFKGVSEYWSTGNKIFYEGESNRDVSPIIGTNFEEALRIMLEFYGRKFRLEGAFYAGYRDKDKGAGLKFMS